jgi:hypothetical protein
MLDSKLNHFIPMEVSRHGLEQAEITGNIDGQHHLVRWKTGSATRPKIVNAWIHSQVLSIVLFPQPLVVHIPCSVCGALTPVRALPEDLAKIHMAGYLCPRHYALQEEARGTID